MSPNFIYLASGSPRRRELLQQIGVSFAVIAASVDETPLGGEAAHSYVRRLAVAKAIAGWEGNHGREPAPVLGADTAVAIDGEILGKPKDRAHAERMLLRLSGRSHQVLTAVALQSERGTELRVSRSSVTFRLIERREADSYWATGEPCDKAGGYAIQGLGAVFVADLQGSYSGVMGLPLFETAELLEAAGITHWQRTQAP